MAARPSRTTRSSAAAAAVNASASGPTAPRTRKTTTLDQPTATAAATGLRRTTRSSRSTTPAPEVKITSSATSSRPSSRASSYATARGTTPVPPSSKPLWNSARGNVSAAVDTPPAGAKRASSLAVPQARTTGAGLLRKMTSRDSIRPPATPARTPAPVRESVMEAYNEAREPLKAYLRIRPGPAGAPQESYIQVMSDSEVLMVPPADHRLNPSSSSSSIFGNALLRSSNINLHPSSHPSGVPDDVLASSTASNHHPPVGPDPSTFGALYKFTAVFPPSSASSPTSESLPSTATSQADFFRATTLPLVTDFLKKGENCLLFAYGPTGSGKTYTVQGGAGDEAGLLPRVMDVVWRSLEGKEGKSCPSTKDTNSEIYNEKIYDLLESPLPAPSPSTSSTTSTGGSSMFGGFLGKGLFKNFPTVKRSALSLKADKGATIGARGATTKVVGGLKEIRVHSTEEAQAVLSRGQANRRVFSTLANRVSSRSHSIFTIKVVRTPLSSSSGVGLAESTARFSIVDLAGSERVVNSGTTGERLKEAGNINKSLMVLGQCMEVLRKNQEREKGRKPAIVPFRHSKLTEMFQSFFVGDGKAVMIVNINPFDTGFDENSHVMKFSAVAKGIMTLKKEPAVLAAAAPALPLSDPEVVQKKPEPRVVRVSLAEGREEEEVIYEEEDLEDGDEEEDEFVNALLDELSALRTALFEAQLNTVLAEANARSRTVQEYEAKMLEMERQYQERAREQAIEAETKLNAKLDILTRLQAAKTPRRMPATPSTADEEAEEEEEEVEKMLLDGPDDESAVADLSTASMISPLAARVKVHLQVDSPTPASPSPIAREPASLVLDGSQAHDAEEHDAEEEDDVETVADSHSVVDEGQSYEDEDDALTPLASEAGDEVEEGEGESIEMTREEEQEEGEQDAEADEPSELSFVDEIEEGEGESIEMTREEQQEESEQDAEADEPSELSFVDEDVEGGGEDGSAASEAGDYTHSGSDNNFASASPSSSNKATPAHASAASLSAEKENEIPTKEEDGDGDDDEYALDKSMVIRSGSKTKKMKRKLGAKVVDAEDLDNLTDGVMSPIATKSTSVRSFKR
ncbi:SPOSA6832_05009 [Sporobolomyces salmonicolor]|uniref:SPOSA6832_05009-mRNA-1:cds n=1 Tax=Sporidiobolus salmonicolor TaxID=5005 RepID=A0A0D6ESL3_SPOSA|nr:SPOSA6832_05009 [Sporobolomyces salmonicolor]